MNNRFGRKVLTVAVTLGLSLACTFGVQAKVVRGAYAAMDTVEPVKMELKGDHLKGKIYNPYTKTNENGYIIKDSTKFCLEDTAIVPTQESYQVKYFYIESMDDRGITNTIQEDAEASTEQWYSVVPVDCIEQDADAYESNDRCYAVKVSWGDQELDSKTYYFKLVTEEEFKMYQEQKNN